MTILFGEIEFVASEDGWPGKPKKILKIYAIK